MLFEIIRFFRKRFLIRTIHAETYYNDEVWDALKRFIPKHKKIVYLLVLLFLYGCQHVPTKSVKDYTDTTIRSIDNSIYNKYTRELNTEIRKVVK